MIKSNLARVTKLEARQNRATLSERAKAWLGLRLPLTPSELAAEPEVDVPALDRSTWSTEFREWIER